MLTGTYLPGDTLIHRARPGVKVLVLAAFTIVLFVASSPVTVAVAAVLVLVLYGLARVPARVALDQVRPLRWVVGLLFAFQWWANGWGTALVVCGNLGVAVAGASLVTLTTRVDDLRAGAVAALRRVPGVDAERIGLLLALTIRSIPVVLALAEETRAARSARGFDRSARAFVAPVLVRTIRHAERVGDALAARGVDD